MRTWMVAAVICAAVSAAGGVSAREWSDPAGRLRFDAPNGWATTKERGAQPGDTFTYIISGTANNECHLISQPNEGTATASADAIRRAGLDPARFSNEAWTRTMNSVNLVFPGSSANILSTSTDTSQFWPIQLAEVQSPRRLVHAAIQVRPGFDLITLCMTYDGADPIDTYTRVIQSVGHPNDATFRADAERLQSERDARSAAQPAARQ